MEKFKLIKLMGLLILSIMFSCSDQLQMTFPEGPQGPQGPQGLSAYDLWVEQVNNGSIEWDKNNTDINNFFLYLKGKDGVDGQNGVDGKSAYQLWVEQVKAGIDNPHNTGTNWPVDNVTMQDFWYFLTGAKGQNGSTPIIGTNGNWIIDGNDTGIPAKGKDGQNGSNGTNGQDGKDGSTPIIGENGNWVINGVDTGVKAFGKDGSNGTNGQNGSNGTNGQNGKSAYELWVEEVAKGLDNPHIPGTLWPKDQTTTADFWEYLRGADGKDGVDGADGTPGESGKPGQDVIIVKGKPNVVAQYSQQEVSEYVKTTDGSVSYIVYDDQGNVAPGAIVSGIPGLDPNLSFTADANGQFTITKDQLPIDLAIADRFGTCQVNYKKSTGSQVTETSAPNTYVPNKMQIRIRITQNPYLYLYPNNRQQYEYISYIVERKTDVTKSWETIPSYLGNLSQKIQMKSLTNMNDPSSYNQTPSIGGTPINISETGAVIFSRLEKKTQYHKPNLSSSDDWDGNDHYYNIVLASYYGEYPHANVVIKRAPIQYMPMVKDLEAIKYDATLGVIGKVNGTFDIGASNANIDPTLLFEKTFIKDSRSFNGNTFDYYYPKNIDISTIIAEEAFEISFAITGNTSDNKAKLASISVPGFTVNTPYIESSVSLYSNSIHFAPYKIIGTLKDNGGVLSVIGADDQYSKHTFNDIPVTQKP